MKVFSLALGVFLAGAGYAQLLEEVPTKLKRVEPNKTCMVKNHRYPNEQDQVKVDGKVFYACCAPCKRALKQDPEVRFAQDPVTGEKIDKSKAILAADSRNRVYYFKSEKTLERHLAKGQRPMADSAAP